MVEDAVRERKTLAEELAKQVNTLSAQKKEVQARIKELQAEMINVEWESEGVVRRARDKAAAQVAEIEASVAPYRDIRDQVQASKNQLAALKQAMQAETSILRQARHEELTRLDSLIRQRQERLAALAGEETLFRARIAQI